jgi:hypothetical protein
MGVHMDAADLLGKIVFWFVLLIFLVPASNALGLPAVSNTINTLVNYIPNVFVAILILFLGTLAATVVGDLVRGAIGSTGIGNANIFASIARGVIIALAALMALEQLQIAPALLNVLFTTIVGGLGLGLALAFGISFGLGGQEAARRWLARGENALGTVSRQVDPDQMRLGAQRANQEAQIQADREAQARQAQVATANAATHNNTAPAPVNPTNYPQSNVNQATTEQQPVPPVQQQPLQTGYPQPYNDPRQGQVANNQNRVPGADEYPTNNPNATQQSYVDAPTETHRTDQPPTNQNY